LRQHYTHTVPKTLPDKNILQDTTPELTMEGLDNNTREDKLSKLRDGSKSPPELHTQRKFPTRNLD
jgi:hypothetical protein